jgi:hypothetical protein
MYYVLLDSTGNLLASYRDEDEARAMLEQLIADDPDAADDIALMTYDDQGELAADPAFVILTDSVSVGVDSPTRWYSTRVESGFASGERTEGRSPIPAGA